MFLLVPAYPGSPGQKAIKRLCVCVMAWCEKHKCRAFKNLLAVYQISELSRLSSVLKVFPSPGEVDTFVQDFEGGMATLNEGIFLVFHTSTEVTV